jgi:predicted nucleic acid-binding Zn ribbon protein
MRVNDKTCVNDKIDLDMKALSHEVPGALAELLRGAPVSQGKVDCAWNVAVGPALQRSTSVRLEGTVLLVDAASPQWAREVARSSRVILSRLQLLLGADTVKELAIRKP